MATTTKPDSGYLDYPKNTQIHKYMVIGDKVHQIHHVIVHKFSVGDVEDPEIYAAEPIIKWQESEMGKWVMGRSVETPKWHRFMDVSQYNYTYAITAYLKDVDYTFWTLKWGTK